MNFLKSNRGGFTLIELLVVVAIISLLSSIVLASLREVRDNAKLSKFQQEVRQLMIAIELYKADYGGELPTDYFVTDASGNSISPELSPYIKASPYFPLVEGDPTYVSYQLRDDNNPESICGDAPATFSFYNSNSMVEKLVTTYGWKKNVFLYPCMPIY